MKFVHQLVDLGSTGTIQVEPTIVITTYVHRPHSIDPVMEFTFSDGTREEMSLSAYTAEVVLDTIGARLTPTRLADVIRFQVSVDVFTIVASPVGDTTFSLPALALIAGRLREAVRTDLLNSFNAAPV